VLILQVAKILVGVKLVLVLKLEVKLSLVLVEAIQELL
jgi:hypothetical protein